MTSAFSWLDQDDGERRRMLEVINLFREKGTLDELGTGTIRDAFADHFFPGTSTIQTRARYFLFIPWLYRQLEDERVRSGDAARHARRLQSGLVDALRAGGEGSNAGLIGIEAGERLQRPPSVVYWQGLRRWGIRLFDGSVDRYHASLDTFYRPASLPLVSDGGELLDRATRNWIATLPPPPSNLLDRTSFALTRQDAEFLLERIRMAAPGSLLAQCLTPLVTRPRIAHAPWELGGLEALDPDLQHDVEVARRFSLLMEGAVLLYNRMLAELAVEQGVRHDATLIDRYGQQLDRWTDELRAESQELRSWDRALLWERLRQLNPRLPAGAVSFADQWMTIAIGSNRPVIDLPAGRTLISARERRLKGPLARLHNPRALERWSGESGLGRLTYRWDQVKTIVGDVLTGLRRPIGDA